MAASSRLDVGTTTISSGSPIKYSSVARQTRLSGIFQETPTNVLYNSNQLAMTLKMATFPTLTPTKTSAIEWNILRTKEPRTTLTARSISSQIDQSITLSDISATQLMSSNTMTFPTHVPTAATLTAPSSEQSAGYDVTSRTVTSKAGPAIMRSKSDYYEVSFTIINLEWISDYGISGTIAYCSLVLQVNAYVCLQVLQSVNTVLIIEKWYAGEREGGLGA